MDFLFQVSIGAGIFFLIIMVATIKTHKDIKNRNDKE